MTMTEQITRPARAGGRGARRTMRAAPDFDKLPALRRGQPECKPMTQEQVEKIDAASMAILEEVGVVFRDDIAPEERRRAGADVQGDRMYPDRHLARELIASIPAART